MHGGARGLSATRLNAYDIATGGEEQQLTVANPPAVMQVNSDKPTSDTVASDTVGPLNALEAERYVEERCAPSRALGAVDIPRVVDYYYYGVGNRAAACLT